MFIARKGDTTTLWAEGSVKLTNPPAVRPVNPKNLSPLNPLNLLNPLNPQGSVLQGAFFMKKTGNLNHEIKSYHD